MGFRRTDILNQFLHIALEAQGAPTVDRGVDLVVDHARGLYSTDAAKLNGASERFGADALALVCGDRARVIGLASRFRQQAPLKIDDDEIRAMQAIIDAAVEEPPRSKPIDPRAERAWRAFLEQPDSFSRAPEMASFLERFLRKTYFCANAWKRVSEQLPGRDFVPVLGTLAEDFANTTQITAADDELIGGNYLMIRVSSVDANQFVLHHLEIERHFSNPRVMYFEEKYYRRTNGTLRDRRSRGVCFIDQSTLHAIARSRRYQGMTYLIGNLKLGMLDSFTGMMSTRNHEDEHIVALFLAVRLPEKPNIETVLGLKSDDEVLALLEAEGQRDAFQAWRAKIVKTGELPGVMRLG